MTSEERQELIECSQRIAELLYQEACEQNQPIVTLGAIEATVRTQVQEHVTPAIGEFFVKPSRTLKRDTPRPVNSILGSLTLTSTQAEQLGVSAYSRLSPHLELCCLRPSTILSYQKAQAEVELQTGRRVCAKTQQRLVPRQSFATPEPAAPIEQRSLDGGMMR